MILFMKFNKMMLLIKLNTLIYYFNKNNFYKTNKFKKLFNNLRLLFRRPMIKFLKINLVLINI